MIKFSNHKQTDSDSIQSIHWKVRHVLNSDLEDAKVCNLEEVHLWLQRKIKR